MDLIKKVKGKMQELKKDSCKGGLCCHEQGITCFVDEFFAELKSIEVGVSEDIEKAKQLKNCLEDCYINNGSLSERANCLWLAIRLGVYLDKIICCEVEKFFGNNYTIRGKTSQGQTVDIIPNEDSYSLEYAFGMAMQFIEEGSLLMKEKLQEAEIVSEDEGKTVALIKQNSELDQAMVNWVTPIPAR